MVGVISSAVVAVAGIAAVVALGIHGTIPGEAVTALLSFIVGGGTAGGTAIASHRATVNALMAEPPRK